MSDQIPEEIMANILLRLRVKDLVSCRRVHKQWLLIIDDPHFIRLQLQLSISTNSNAALYLQDKESPILYWKRRYASDINFFSTPIQYEPTRVLLMGSCHGLVCFSLFNYPNDFVVLNPSTGERHIVSIPMEEKRLCDKLEVYGFGHDELLNDYKLVRIMKSEVDGSRHSHYAEIFTIRSKGFCKTIPLPTAVWNHHTSKSIGVFVGGAIHWCTLNPTNTSGILGHAREHVINAIDLVSNTYCQLQCPSYKFGQTLFDYLNVGIVDTRLSLCGVLNNVSKIGIWVMDEYGNPESWNRLYCIVYDGCLPYTLTSVGSNGDKTLLMLDWQSFAWCDPTMNEGVTILAADACWDCGSYEAMYCLESLVKIFPNRPADVKKDAYEKQLERLADREILQNGHPVFLNRSNLDALMYEDYVDYGYYVEHDDTSDYEF